MNFIITWLLSLLSYFWTSIKAWLPATLSVWFGTIASRIPLLAAVTSMIVTVTAAYLLLMHNEVTALNETIPDVVSDVWGWVMPSNAVPCLLALLTTRLFKWLYINYRSLLETKINTYGH